MDPVTYPNVDEFMAGENFDNATYAALVRPAPVDASSYLEESSLASSAGGYPYGEYS